MIVDSDFALIMFVNYGALLSLTHLLFMNHKARISRVTRARCTRDESQRLCKYIVESGPLISGLPSYDSLDVCQSK